MYVHRTTNYKNIPYYTCSKYTKVPCGSLCKSAHRVKADNVIKLIAEILKEIKKSCEIDDEKFIKSLKEEVEINKLIEIKESKNRLSECTSRAKQLEKLMCRIYEDMINDKIPTIRYETLNRQYETEQLSLNNEIESLNDEIASYNNSQKGISKFIDLIKKYDDFDELDTLMINEFVERIIVHERDVKYSASSNQTIEIYFNFIGEYKLKEEELSEEEMLKRAEEERKIRERKERLHQNYLKRKESGKQEEYYAKYKARREKLKKEKISNLISYGIKVKNFNKSEKGENYARL